MRLRWAGVCAVVALLGGVSVAEEPPLVAGRDVPAPRRIVWRQPDRPALAQKAGVVGLVLLDVTVDETGKPVDIRVVRGEAILDKTAIDSVIASRYEPTVVDGRPRRVVLTIPIEFFGDLDGAVKYYRRLASDNHETLRTRVFAVSRLARVPPARRAEATDALRVLSSSPAPEVAAAATAALQGGK